MATSGEILKALAYYIRPATFPVGVLPLARVAEAPPALLDKAKAPARDLGHGITVCMGVGLARRYGWTVLVRREDNICPLGGIAMGFEPAKEKFWDGSLFAEYTGRPREAVARYAQETKRFEEGSYEGILMAPLQAGEFEPEVTIVYGDSAQVMRLVQAALFFRGGHLRSQASGGLDCSDLIVQTLQAGDCQFVLPCNGDRVFGMAQDHEMAFTIPRARADEVLRGLEASHQAGQRYPVPTFMRFEPRMPAPYTRLMEYLRRDEP
jgi:uncharacterized protein (DUF169 family)